MPLSPPSLKDRVLINTYPKVSHLFLATLLSALTSPKLHYWLYTISVINCLEKKFIEWLGFYLWNSILQYPTVASDTKIIACICLLQNNFRLRHFSAAFHHHLNNCHYRARQLSVWSTLTYYWTLWSTFTKYVFAIPSLNSTKTKA